MQPARQQQMARLAAEEGHGVAGFHRHAHDGAGGAVDAARQVDGDDRRAARIDRLDHGARQALDRPVEPGPEQRIDHDRLAADRRRRGLLERPLPARGGLRRIALEPAALAHEEEPHLVAALGQNARRHEAVAAIIAGARHHDGRPARQQAGRRVGHGAAGILHQARCRACRRQWSAGRPRPFPPWSSSSIMAGETIGRHAIDKCAYLAID